MSAFHWGQLLVHEKCDYFLRVLRQMADSFMVRDSRNPMQWILDLRTYGIKIHYNTTTKSALLALRKLRDFLGSFSRRTGAPCFFLYSHAS